MVNCLKHCIHILARGSTEIRPVQIKHASKGGARNELRSPSAEDECRAVWPVRCHCTCTTIANAPAMPPPMARFAARAKTSLNRAFFRVAGCSGFGAVAVAGAGNGSSSLLAAIVAAG
eukprot:4326887-Pleurochrysis_carterae.AAC.2